jgi:hypothetical protein
VPDKLWEFRNDPVNEVQLGRGQTINPYSNCAGYAIDWARNILAGRNLVDSRPIPGDLTSGVLARAHSINLSAGDQGLNLDQFYDGALLARRMFKGPITEGRNITQILAHIADVAPPNQVYCVHLECGDPGARQSHAIAIYKHSPDKLYVFDAELGLSRFNSRQDFNRAINFYHDVFNHPDQQCLYFSLNRALNLSETQVQPPVQILNPPQPHPGQQGMTPSPGGQPPSSHAPTGPRQTRVASTLTSPQRRADSEARRKTLETDTSTQLTNQATQAKGKGSHRR